MHMHALKTQHGAQGYIEARGEAECCISLETPTGAIYFLYSSRQYFPGSLRIKVAKFTVLSISIESRSGYLGHILSRLSRSSGPGLDHVHNLFYNVDAC